MIDSKETTEKHCFVAKDEETGFFFDAMMKKVDVKKYFYGLDNYYVVQILRDQVKKLYIVWTRWGRSGTEGQFQRTPFGHIEDAKKEFSRVFRLKSGFPWIDVKDYVKVKGKYDVKRIGGKLTSRSDAKLKFSNADFDFEKLLVPLDSLDYSIEMVNPTELMHFIKPLISDTNIQTNLQHSNFPSSVMLLCPTDAHAVNQAIEVLKCLINILKEADKHRRNHKFPEYQD